jgi:GST-like protein
MIDLYTFTTPNGYKVSIALEELGLEYEVIPVDISKGEQFEPQFLEISPNNKIPAIVDHEGPAGAPMALFESGAILLYLAEKTGKLLSKDPVARWKATEWLFFQMASVGPMLGQVHHFRSYAKEKIPYAIDRYTNEARRIYGVLDKRLGEVEYLAGDYSVADIAVWPWLRNPQGQGVEVAEFPNVVRWRSAIEARPAVKRGVEVPPTTRDPNKAPGFDEKQHDILFGKKQFERR